jgi:molecular chaperone HtpG
MFYSSADKKLVTLKAYVSRMKEEQKYIYYACGAAVDNIDKLPQTERVKDKGFEILYLTEDVDEFVLKAMMNYGEKEFKSVSSGDLGFEDGEDKKQDKEPKEMKKLFACMKEALGDKVKDVRASARLKSHPVCIASDGELSLEMEKVLSAMPNSGGLKAERVLEINKDHAVFTTLERLYKEDKDRLEKYTRVLYNSALLIEGIAADDPMEFTNDICELIG